jgi:protein O-mannosyl-transferase
MVQKNVQSPARKISKGPAERGKSTPAPSFFRRHAGLLISMLLLALLTGYIYRENRNAGFTNWDDPTYVIENAALKLPASEMVKYFFTHPSASNYHPLTMISLGMDYKKTPREHPDQPDTLDLDATRFHTTNLVLHILDVLLVLLFIYLLAGRRIIPALITALWFAVHPMHVESVAWISERKDVLYAFFFLAGLITYLVYIERKSVLWLLATTLLFILSLLSKPAAVVFPLVLFLIDYYKGNKITTKGVVIKSVLLLFSVAFGLATFLIQSKDAIANFSTFTIFQRFLFASYGFAMYLWKMILPINLSAFYPYPNLTLSGYLPVIFYLLPLVFIAVALLTWYSARKTKVIAFGILFYFVNVALVLQFISVGSALMSDRYTYVASIGLFFIAGYYTDKVWSDTKRIRPVLRYLVIIFATAYSAFLVMQTTDRIVIWKDTETLWTDVINKYKFVETAYKNRGNYYASKNRTEDALKDYDILMQMHTKDPKIYSNLGNIYGLRGELDKALDAYNRSLALDSNAYDTYLNIGVTLARSQKYAPAVENFEKALRLNPEGIDVIEGLAYSLIDAGQPERAIGYFNTLLKASPGRSDYYFKRAICYYNLKRKDESAADYKTCLSLNPSNGYAWFNLSVIYNERKEWKGAYECLQKAQSAGIHVDPKYIQSLETNMKIK